MKKIPVKLTKAARGGTAAESSVAPLRKAERGDDPLLIGVDLGTTVCKALVFDAGLRILGSGARNLPLATLSGSRIEQSPESWWTGVVEAVREAMAASGADAARVKGLSVSSQGITFAPVDAAGAPLRDALTWMDTRAGEQARRVSRRMGEKRIFSITGKRCNEAYVLPKLLWLMENEPGTLRRCARILMPLDFLMARLTGESVTDPSMASGTMLFDIGRREWSARILDAFGIDARILPAVVPGGAAVGTLRPHAAEALGLPRGVVVAMGGQDQKVAALGAGIDRERCTVSLGTAMAITQKCGAPVIDGRMRLPCFADPLPERWVLEGFSNCCNVLDWVRGTFFPDRGYDALDRMAAEAAGKGSAACLLPFFSGAPAPHPDPDARGMLCGLDFTTGPGHIVRGVFDGIAFMIRANMDVMEEVVRPVRELRVFGGGSRSATWCQIIADATRRPVRTVGTAEAGSVGAAMLAGMGCGAFADAAEAQARVSPAAAYAPRPADADAYDGLYAEFQRLRERLLRRGPRAEARRRA
jgi:xylulokinase